MSYYLQINKAWIKNYKISYKKNKNHKFTKNKIINKAFMKIYYIKNHKLLISYVFIFIKQSCKENPQIFHN